MGQYYKPTIISLDANKKATILAWLYSHDFKSTYKREDGSTFKSGSGLKLMEHSWLRNGFVGAVERLFIEGGAHYKGRLVWSGDYAEGNLYDKCDDKLKIHPRMGAVPQKYRYIVNHDAKVYVDKKDVLSRDGWAIHPLPLLTCEGNGQGGGDYNGADPDNIVGTWARCSISIETEIPAGYTKIPFNLYE